MTEELISFPTAKLAKEKGFNLIVKNYYYPEAYGTIIPIINDHDINVNINAHESNAYYSAPTQSLLQRWLREVHKISINIFYERGNWYYILFKLPNSEDILKSKDESNQDADLYLDDERITDEWFTQENKSYEKALEIGLQEALKLI